MSSLRSRHSLRLAAAAALSPAPVLAVAAVPAPPAEAQPAPPQGVELRSTWEEANPACDISRDGGLSIALPGNPGQSLWLFGDTGITGGPGCGFKSLGTHAAISVNTPGQVPLVNEIPAPGINGAPGPAVGPLPNGSRKPAQFLPNPTGLVQNDGSPCSGPDGSAMATWFGAAAQGPNQPMDLSWDGTPVHVEDGSDLIFISYEEVCIERELWDHDNDPSTPEQSRITDLIGERIGFVAWDPSINSLVARWTVWNGMTDGDPSTPRVSAVPLGSPTFIDDVGMVTYGARCLQASEDDCQSGKTVLVGVWMDDLDDPNGYKYFVGGAQGWTHDFDQAAPLKPLSTNGRGPHVSAVADYSGVGEGLLMYDQTALFEGTYQLWQQADSDPLATWSLIKSGVQPGSECSGGFGCYYPAAHPEISTATDLMFSIYDSVSGEIEVSSLGALP